MGVKLWPVFGWFIAVGNSLIQNFWYAKNGYCDIPAICYGT